jgi:hypothetical protein
MRDFNRIPCPTELSEPAICLLRTRSKLPSLFGLEGVSNSVPFLRMLQQHKFRYIDMNPTGVKLGWACSSQQVIEAPKELLDIDATNIENVDDLRVDELNQLSKEARERAQDEVHCVVDELSIEEEPEFVERRLAQMEDEVSKTRKKSAYDRALFLSPSYVRDRDFSLMFLRSTDFHPSKAAECMIAHFELKLELFGLECLARAVTLEDLNEEDIVTLKAGNCQCLSEKDRGGRTVFCGLFKIQQNTSRVSTTKFIRGICWLSFPLSLTPSFVFCHEQRRTNFYQSMVGLEDVETQKRGVVLVFYHCHYDGYDMVGREEIAERLTNSLNFIRGLPWKFMGIHFCCSEESVPFFLPFQNIVQYMIGQNGRRHFRAHRGKNILYAPQLLVTTLNDSTSNPWLLYTYTIRGILQRLDYGN